MIETNFNYNNRFDVIQSLPEEIAFEIFSYLDPIELGRCCAVSCHWNAIASDERLWKQLFPGLAVPQDKSVKEYVDLCSIKSMDELVVRIQKFVQRVQLNKKGEFRCLFPFNPKCSALAVIGYGKMDSHADPDLKELCIYVKKSPQVKDEPKSLSFDQCYDPPVQMGGRAYHLWLKMACGSEKSIILKNDMRYPTDEGADYVMAYHRINTILQNRIKDLKKIATKQRKLDLCRTSVSIVLMTAGVALSLLKMSKSN